MNSDDELTQARHRVESLRRELSAHNAAPAELRETHISWILLAGDHAYKFKKPVRLPFLDFSTLAARRHFCEEELRVNRRLAGTLYLALAELREAPGGASFEAAGPVLDVAVKMRRFPDGALWSERLAAGRLGASDIDALAARLAAFHREAEAAGADTGHGGPLVYQRLVHGLMDGLDSRLADADAAAASRQDWEIVRAWLPVQVQQLAGFWERRRQDGHVREGHGDLHLANLLQRDDGPTAFDAIEFDPQLRWIDVLHDMAFVPMDLMAHGAPALAWRFIDAYLEASGDYEGLPLLRFSLVCRALVRAQVSAIAQAQGQRGPARVDAGRYLGLAASLVRAQAPRLAITFGLPGSGKTTVSQQLLEGAGAVRVRSDVERKRLFGLAAQTRSQPLVPGGIYDDDSTARTYARLADVARIALGAAWPTLVDAAFLRGQERARFAELAAASAVPFTILQCQGAPALLRERLARRQAEGRDASEADAQVLERLAAVAEPLDGAELAQAIPVDAAAAPPAGALVRAWQAARSVARALAWLALIAACALPATPTRAASCAERADRPQGMADFASIAARTAAIVVKLTMVGASHGNALQADDDGPSGLRPRARLPASAPWGSADERSSASGFVIDPEGYILTSAHAVMQARLIWIDLQDQRRLQARLVGLDRQTDVAVLKIAASGLQSAVIAADPTVCPGEWVVAVGAPFGFDRSVTAGIVSANPRFLPLGGDVPLIQTDVALNPGSSGGPLFNGRGEVVGMNSMIFSATGGFAGLSFSSPIALVMDIAAQIRAEGRVRRGRIGVTIQQVTPDLARAFGLDGAFGALLIRVDPQAPGGKAGLRSGDIVVSIDGISPASHAEIQQQVAAARPGQSLTLGIWRHRALLRVSVVAQAVPADPAPTPTARRAHASQRLGLAFAASGGPDETAGAPGLRVVTVEGPALTAGLMPGDTVVAVNDIPVMRAPDFDAAIKAVRGNGPIALLVGRRGAMNYLPVWPDDD